MEVGAAGSKRMNITSATYPCKEKYIKWGLDEWIFRGQVNEPWVLLPLPRVWGPIYRGGPCTGAGACSMQQTVSILLRRGASLFNR
jgi:hypothetical protein